MYKYVYIFYKTNNDTELIFQQVSKEGNACQNRVEKCCPINSLFKTNIFWPKRAWKIGSNVSCTISMQASMRVLHITFVSKIIIDNFYSHVLLLSLQNDDKNFIIKNLRSCSSKSVIIWYKPVFCFCAKIQN